ncbi:LPS-assembly protein LptD [Asticcacaulis sp. AC402]|uniref:LPS-assembly protein LptD n=1 Tax=Asticcacaulis sp. AC402 TaxID=1282361 RepID=UPI001F1CB269|nr:LPS assembly protein LptD [Asticcacaulis sp. AC402]
MSLMAIGGGAAQARALSDTPIAGGSTLTQLSFEMAMAQAVDVGVAEVGAAELMAATPGDIPPDTQPAQPARPSTNLGKETVGPDGLVEGAAYIEADQIAQTEDELIIAYGRVEMRHKGKIIRADTVSYNPNSGVTIASGHTQTINADGSIQFADYISYDDEMQSGISENFASLGADEQKVFARKVEAVDPDTNRLTDVIYTPCQLCVEKGETQEPSWSIQASEITQRRDKKMVYYKNAMFRLQGVPVFYTPYMWTPDPELERASGLLPPKVAFAGKRGFSWEQPYLWSISPYQQLIISPQINLDAAPLLNLDYQRHFYSGVLHARFGFTNESYFDNDSNKIGPEDVREYILADGRFKINENWRWSFTAEHVKDDADPDILDERGDPIGRGRSFANFFERYDIEDAFNRNERYGELTVDSRQLVNQVNVSRQASNAYLSFNILSFQNLQFDGLSPADQPIAVDSQIYPTIAPMIEAAWSPRSRILGGQLTVSLNAIGLKHKDFPGNDVAPAAADGSSGFDTARVTVGARYYGDMTTRSGIRWGPFLDARHDSYKLSNLDSSGLEGDLSRGLATAGVNVSYPLIKKYNGVTAIIEPVAQLALSPDYEPDVLLPREDSQSFEFDATNLFMANKSPGFDVYESGARLNLGFKTRLIFESGLKVEGLIGRTVRDKAETQYLKTRTVTGVDYTYDLYGLGNKNSDWIVNASFDTSDGIYGYSRLRVDSEETKLSQGEVGLSVVRPNTRATLRYVFNDLLTNPGLVENGKLQRFGDNYRNMQLYARHFITPNWGVSARLDRDLVENTWRRSTVSLIYRNDCIWYELIYQRNDSEAYRLRGRPSSAILFRLNLSTLGSSGAEFNDVR